MVKGCIDMSKKELQEIILKLRNEIEEYRELIEVMAIENIMLKDRIDDYIYEAK